MSKSLFCFILLSILTVNSTAQQSSLKFEAADYHNSMPAPDSQTASSTPPAPVLLSPKPGCFFEDLSASLCWQETVNTEFYHLQVSTDPEFKNILIDHPSLAAAEYTAAGLAYEKTYFWRVRAVSILSIGNWSEIFHFFTIDFGPLLSSPSDGKTAAAAHPVLSWQSKTGASNYWLQAAYDAEFKYLVADDSAITETSYQLEFLQGSQQYFWRVKSKRNGYFSLWSDTFSFITFNGLDGWTNQFSGINSSLNDIYFQDEQKGWISGAGGKIIKTNNGGALWEIADSPVSAALEAVYFINETAGWAAGWEGRILKTTDGGRSWSIKSSGTSFILRDICFSDEDNGWAAGERGVILNTTDGGETWNTVSNIPNNEYYSIYFSSADNGCIAGTSWNGSEYSSLLLYTRDGGKVWTAQNFTSISFLTSMSFINPDTGWAAGSNGCILYTIDGGVHWTIQNNDKPYDLYSIHFTDKLNGWAAGTNGMCVTTADGGYAWDAKPLGTRNSVRSIYFTNPDKGWTAGGSGSIFHTASRGIKMIPQIKSPADKAAAQPLAPVLSWKQTPMVNTFQVQIAKDKEFTDLVSEQNISEDSSYSAGPLAENTVYYWRIRSCYQQMYSSWCEAGSFETEGVWKLQPTNIKTDLNDLYFIDTQFGFCAGDSGTIISTSSGGDSWQRLNTPVKADLHSICFFDSYTGIAAGDSGTIIRTTDAGTGWEQVPLNSALQLKSVCFAGDSGWAAGSAINNSTGRQNSVILRTLDRGKNWTIQQFDDPAALQDIFFIDAQHGWAAGSGPEKCILLTEDGGENWKAVEINCDVSLNKIFFIDKQTGVAAGSNGTIYTSFSGGQSWIPVIFPSNAEIEDVCFISAKKSLVLANGVFTADENYSNWNTRFLDSSTDFNAAAFADELTGWIAGDNGLVLKTTSGGSPADTCCPGQYTTAQKFLLHQNYPNPFNGEAIIKYDVSDVSDSEIQIRLDVFNILGQRVRTLVNKKQGPGNYAVNFDSRGLASGVYIYRLKAGGKTIKSKKLMLIR